MVCRRAKHAKGARIASGRLAYGAHQLPLRSSVIAKDYRHVIGQARLDSANSYGHGGDSRGAARLKRPDKSRLDTRLPGNPPPSSFHIIRLPEVSIHLL